MSLKVKRSLASITKGGIEFQILAAVLTFVDACAMGDVSMTCLVDLSENLGTDILSHECEPKVVCSFFRRTLLVRYQLRRCKTPKLNRIAQNSLAAAN